MRNWSSIVKKLTELHGGTVVATSAGGGQGSEFTIRLPAEVGDEEAPGAQSAFTNVHFAGEHGGAGRGQLIETALAAISVGRGDRGPVEFELIE